VGDLIESNTLLTTMSQLDPVKVQFPLSEPEYLGFAARLATVGQGTETPKDTLELVLADGSTYPHRGSFMFAVANGCTRVNGR
jgi:membrane fusion protein (multidrug efflux system)